jgi:DNA-directed RNA polymerase specialized sigma24 family protein
MDDAVDSTRCPDRLAAWTEFHEKVGQLPAEEQEAFHLLWYQDLKEAEAAALIGVSVRTLQRRWQSARLKLHHALRGELPF